MKFILFPRIYAGAILKYEYSSFMFIHRIFHLPIPIQFNAFHTPDRLRLPGEFKKASPRHFCMITSNSPRRTRTCGDGVAGEASIFTDFRGFKPSPLK